MNTNHMPSCLFIVTGYSRGIGRALVHELSTSLGHAWLSKTEASNAASNASSRESLTKQMVLIGRTEPHLDVQEFIQADLSKPLAQEILDRLKEKMMSSNYSSIHLIYAAGVIEPLGFDPGQSFYESERSSYFVNAGNFFTLARICLPFQRITPDESLVFHLSSGAALNAYADLASYCSSKASALMFARCLAQESMMTKLRVLSVAPGTVATEMTRKLAQSDALAFPGLQKFRDLQAEGKYSSVDEAGSKLHALLFKDENQKLRERIHGKYYDLRKPGQFES